MQNQVTIDSLLVTPQQQLLANIIAQKTRIYKDNFDRLSLYCDSHMNGPGVMSAVNSATIAIKSHAQYNIFANQDINQLALATGKLLINMQESQKQLAATGINYVGVMELSRRVLDAQIPESQPILISVE